MTKFAITPKDSKLDTRSTKTTPDPSEASINHLVRCDSMNHALMSGFINRPMSFGVTMGGTEVFHKRHDTLLEVDYRVATNLFFPVMVPPNVSHAYVGMTAAAASFGGDFKSREFDGSLVSSAGITVDHLENESEIELPTSIDGSDPDPYSSAPEKQKIYTMMLKKCEFVWCDKSLLLVSSPTWDPHAMYIELNNFSDDEILVFGVQVHFLYPNAIP